MDSVRKRPNKMFRMNIVGTRLRERARQLGLTDAEVARRAGLAERRYGHYVSGAREPNFETLVRICRVLATTPNQLLGFEAASEQTDDALLRQRLLAVVDLLDVEHLNLAIAQIEALADHQRASDQ